MGTWDLQLVAEDRNGFAGVLRCQGCGTEWDAKRGDVQGLRAGNQGGSNEEQQGRETKQTGLREDRTG